jgi:hypothetical protein
MTTTATPQEDLRHPPLVQVSPAAPTATLPAPPVLSATTAHLAQLPQAARVSATALPGRVIVSNSTAEVHAAATATTLAPAAHPTAKSTSPAALAATEWSSEDDETLPILNLFHFTMRRKRSLNTVHSLRLFLFAFSRQAGPDAPHEGPIRGPAVTSLRAFRCSRQSCTFPVLGNSRHEGRRWAAKAAWGM